MAKEAALARPVLAAFLVLLTIYVVPLLVYGAASVAWGLQPPSGASPGRFLFGILITKLGTAIAFVALLSAARAVWGDRWLLYAFIWFVMFAFSELGEAISGRTSRLEAILGVVSEAIYAPAAAFLAQWILGRSPG